MNTNRSIKVTLASLAWSVLMLASVSAGAQDIIFNNAHAGQPLIYAQTSGQDKPTTDPFGTYVDAYVYVHQGGGLDICSKINSAWTDSLTGTGAPTSVTIDARGFAPSGSALACSNNSPFPTSPAAKGRLLLGNYTITTTAPWKIPSGVEVVGLGGSGVGTNTIIQAASGFSSADQHNALVELGGVTGGTESDTKLRGVTVDCNNQTNCTVGIFNFSAVDNSWVQDVVINNASQIGLYVVVGNPGIGGADSGVYQRITVQYSNSCCTTQPIGIELAGDDSGTLVRGLDDITISGCGLSGGSSSSYGIYVVGASTKIVNANIECFQTGIQIGDPTYSGSYSTHNIQVDNVYFHCSTATPGCPAGTGVAVAGNSSKNIIAANVSLANVGGSDYQGASLNNLVQYYNGSTLVSRPGLSEGSLLLGDPKTPNCSTKCAGLLASDPAISWIVPGGSINP